MNINWKSLIALLLVIIIYAVIIPNGWNFAIFRSLVPLIIGFVWSIFWPIIDLGDK